MNTIAWLMTDDSGARTVWALHGATALYVAGYKPDAVYQITAESGCEEAKQYLVTQTALFEQKGGRLVGSPVEFNLSLKAMSQIHTTSESGWVVAPMLCNELTMAASGRSVLDPLVIHATGIPASPAMGSVHFDSSGVLKVYDGTAWTPLGYTSGLRGAP